MDYSEFKCKWIDPESLWTIKFFFLILLPIRPTSGQHLRTSHGIPITQLLRFVEFICQRQMRIDFFLVLKRTPLFPSNADFNQISSVCAKFRYWQVIRTFEITILHRRPISYSLFLKKRLIVLNATCQGMG